MTDPLRPFTQAIRSLWHTRTRRGGNASDSSGTSTAASTTRPAGQRPRASRAGETLHSRLQSRIAALDGTDAKKMRDAFVETVLIWELGDQLAPDPGFAEMVARVSQQLAADPDVGDRLHQLLRQLSDRREIPR